tara:strand:+ start:2910 stop:3857 length:948 start_codon:yes stop_codon:yes gene_type:complete
MTTASDKWKILFHEPNSIKTVVSSVVGIMSRAEFQLKKLKKEDHTDSYYLCVDITDMSRVCCVSARLAVDESFNIPDDLSFVLDLKELLTALKCMQPRYTVEIGGKIGGHKIEIRGFDVNDRARDTTIILGTRIAEETNFKPPIFEYKMQVEIDLNMLKGNMNNGKAINAELLKFQVKKKTDEQGETKCVTIFTCEGNSTIKDTMRCITETDPTDGSIRVKENIDIANYDSIEEEDLDTIYEGTFSSTNLHNFVNALPGPPKSKLIANIKKSMPLCLTYLIGDEVNASYIKLLLAPRNVDDEEPDDGMEDVEDDY